MKIKRLEIVGFKSFVDKVVLDFQQGVTGVVGPNGCGKSNIVDAIRWVMGEQNARHLRGRAMEDVIFGGSENRKPLGMAEVSMVFDNSAGLSPPAYRDYAEIMVTRRLYRNGDSEYQLNKTPCRLLDITELFMDTGAGARAYSIIEQGKVGMLVSAKPEERRALIEEAAGVTKYKARKKTALRKMDATRQNLVRLGDVISEVRRTLGSLKRQAQRAEKFREYRAEAKRIELCLVGNRYRVLKEALSAVDGETTECARQLEQLELQLAESELQIEKQQCVLLEAEECVAQSQQQIYHLGAEIQRVESEKMLAQKQLDSLSGLDEQLDAERVDAEQRLNDLEREERELSQLNAELNRSLIEAERQDITHKDRLQVEERCEADADRRLNVDRRQLLDLLNEASRLANRREEISRRLQEEEARQIKNQEELAALADQQRAGQKKLAELEQTWRQQQMDRDALQAQSDQMAKEKGLLRTKQADAVNHERELQQSLERQRSRLESLQELEQNFDGYAEGVRLLLADGSVPRKVVADVLQVPPQYERAVEMALADRLQAIPIENVSQVQQLFGQLRERRARATLFFGRTTHDPLAAAQGATPLESLLSCQGEGANVARSLLAGVFLVERLEPYLGQPLAAGTLLVTADGDCLTWRGDMAGGAPVATGAGLLSKKRELKDLSAGVEQAEGVLAASVRQRQELDLRLQQTEEEARRAVDELHRQELLLLEQSKDLDRSRDNLQRIEDRMTLVRFEADQLNEGQELLRAEQDERSRGSEMTDRQRSDLEQRIATAEAELASTRDRLQSQRAALTAVRVEMAGLKERREGGRSALLRVQRSREEIQGRLVSLQTRRATGNAEKLRLQSDFDRLGVEQGLLLDRHQEQQAADVAVREQAEGVRKKLDVVRDEQRQIRSRTEDRRKDLSRLQLRQRELSVDAEHMRQTVDERYRVDLDEHMVPEADSVELERQQAQLQRLTQRIAALGEVNLTAIDEYKEQEERYDFLTRQRDDLQQSLDDLQKAINKINRTTRRRFQETFTLVNEKFKEVFPRLFRGGQAELKLTEEDDLLQTGVEIVVQPPGKRLQNVTLLSGGEKALTAVALIFSLFLIKPTPFCVLDEVDAPLDDANIERFAEMVRDMSASSQFILITHSKRTMANAEVMYGVTMEDPGASKIVSVRMNDYRSDNADSAAV
ncbi:MAG: chromosome segregation protein SMC [Desulfuromonas sp.]|nr:MAG: chromosome segregation protein SMC [Desulfuromonas sp.]